MKRPRWWITYRIQNSITQKYHLTTSWLRIFSSTKSCSGRCGRARRKGYGKKAQFFLEAGNHYYSRRYGTVRYTGDAQNFTPRRSTSIRLVRASACIYDVVLAYIYILYRSAEGGEREKKNEIYVQKSRRDWVRNISNSGDNLSEKGFSLQKNRCRNTRNPGVEKQYNNFAKIVFQLSAWHFGYHSSNLRNWLYRHAFMATKSTLYRGIPTWIWKLFDALVNLILSRVCINIYRDGFLFSFVSSSRSPSSPGARVVRSGILRIKDYEKMNFSNTYYGRKYV